MKKLIAIIFTAFLMTSCEYPIGEINRWWHDDVLKTETEEQEMVEVTITIDWPGDESWE